MYEESMEFQVVRTCERCGHEVDHECHHVDGELELHELLDVDVHGASPFGHVDDGGEVVVHDDHVGVLLCNLRIHNRKQRV